jgi:pimeloyl-ACP methyl ester carboxylesterase
MLTYPPVSSQKHILPVLMLLCGLLIVMSGCSLKEVYKQTKIIENVSYIKGNIKVTSDQEGPVIVRRFRDEKGIPVRESQVTASGTGDFMFSVFTGSHYIAAFIDVNKDGQYQPGEHGSFYGHPSKIDLASKQTVTLETIIIAGEFHELKAEFNPIDGKKAIWKNIGKVVTLDDPRFSPANYSMGLWKPFNFLDQAEGGLFFLQEYQDGKVPIIFVHGVMGGPTNWKSVIESLDNMHFQPWAIYYPSGVRLDMISNYLVEAVNRLQSKYGFSEYIIIAHSMGGLVTRSFVKKYVAHSSGNTKNLRLVMTVNSPMTGMPAAASGVKHSPIVVPSWRDVAPGSDFLRGINDWNWPREIPYHLVASYVDGKSSDGVAPLTSQTPLKLQSESIRMYVFNNDHVGTLNDKKFHTLLNRILAETFKK